MSHEHSADVRMVVLPDMPWRADVHQIKPSYASKPFSAGTACLEWYKRNHENVITTLAFQRQLPIAARKKVMLAAALALCVDVGPLSFCNDEGITVGTHTMDRANIRLVSALGSIISSNADISIVPALFAQSRMSRQFTEPAMRQQSKELLNRQNGMGNRVL